MLKHHFDAVAYLFASAVIVVILVFVYGLTVDVGQWIDFQVRQP